MPRWPSKNLSLRRNPNRFNVATSRAIDVTIAIVGAVPDNAQLISKFFAHFGLRPPTTHLEDGDQTQPAPTSSRFSWVYRPDARESEFEVRVDEHLHKFIRSCSGSAAVHLYNQVQACGEKRLDFVLYNSTNGECCAIEVDGRDHFCQDGRSYSEEHLSRVDILSRAGWKIVHVPYYEWYRNGWLCDEKPEFSKWLGRFFDELRVQLGVGR